MSVGLAELWRRHELRRLATISAIQNGAYSATMAILVLYIVNPGPMNLNSSTYGLLLTTSAVGGLAAGWLSSGFIRKFGEDNALRMWTPAVGVGLGLVACTTTPWTAALGLLLYGFSTMVWNVVVVTYRHRSVSPDHFGRVNAAYRWLTWGAMPVGSVGGGVLGELIGVRWAVGVSGVVATMAGLAVLRLLRGSVTLNSKVSGKSEVSR